MSTLTGLIGSQPIVSSWPSAASPDWREPYNASLSLTGTLSDMLNLTSSSGYLLALELKKAVNTTQTVQCKITVDGTVIKNMTGSTAGDNKIIVFWPPTVNDLPRSTIPFANGSIPPSFPLRFESSLRVQFKLASGTAVTVVGQYILT